MLHSDKKRETRKRTSEYNRKESFLQKDFSHIKNKHNHSPIQKGNIMRTVLFAYYFNSEAKHEALYEKQSLDFMRSYKMRRKRKTVSDIEEGLV